MHIRARADGHRKAHFRSAARFGKSVDTSVLYTRGISTKKKKIQNAAFPLNTLRTYKNI